MSRSDSLPKGKPINVLSFQSLGIDTNQEHIAFMRKDCEVCRSEGFESLTRVRVSTKSGPSVVATVNVINSDLLGRQQISLSEQAQKKLDVSNGDALTISHLEPLRSLSDVRKKIYGNQLDRNDFYRIIQDIQEGRYTNAHISAFIAAITNNLNRDEMIFLTRSMIQAGQTLSWSAETVADKHCIGGLPGNRTTPIVVSILACTETIIPKTSSRAITSPAGTADTMEVMTRVDLSREEIQNVVRKEKGCIVWGGTASISPADEPIARVERTLDIDCEEQLIASVLSKKAAIGSTHIVLDIPVGKTVKVRSREEAEALRDKLIHVGKALGLQLEVVLTDGQQPVGRGIGPALEAMDVLSVLRNEEKAPDDLRKRALTLAGALLDLIGTNHENGMNKARNILDSGKAREKFRAICRAQGAFNEPEEAPYKADIKADRSGIVAEIDNRRLARAAKLAGAPQDRRAGIRMHVSLGQEVRSGDLLLTLHAETTGELRYAKAFIQTSEDNILTITSSS